ncbi:MULTISPECIES: helix-turn-helix domain-containing protein [Paenibacillus]|jgi:transcriptional regulator with XRE-family HTH domain|uniref:helix-turn-helix domain-containing protein n=1 Tax=Paenibacillus TaxID=44249 RepID=UPI0003F6E735|nr:MULTISPECIES: helix-turn-helix transcriptional regulator [Paenibacillus]UMY54871.1 helix-turn-helix domain-containing protein [Paenibacillus peoriae]
MTKLRNSVGERIRAIRKAKGLTQQQLAELSGLDDAYIGSVERGERNFSIDTLEKILIGLNVSAYSLFYNSDNYIDSIQMKIIDNYSSIISELSPKQVQNLNNIISEFRNAFK